MQDFNKNVLTCNIDYWRIDNGLKDILININNNPDVQTLYSKNYDSCKCESCRRNGGESYLIVSISRKYEEKMCKIVKQFKKLFKNGGFMFEEYCDFFNGGGSKISNMECNKNPQYFNISSFKFQLVTNDEKRQRFFWQFLNNNLSK